MYPQLLTLLLRKITLPICGLFLAVLFVVSLSGCGNKSALFLPEDNATTYSNTYVTNDNTVDSKPNNTLPDNSEL